MATPFHENEPPLPPAGMHSTHGPMQEGVDERNERAALDYLERVVGVRGERTSRAQAGPLT